MSKFGGGIGAPSKEERLKAAAEIHLRLGQIQRYCELMVELGEWEKALSVAPGVSMKYWKKLMQRRADQLMQEGNDDVIPYCIATGDVKKLVSFFTSRGQLKEALLVAQGACEGNIHRPAITSINHTVATDNDNNEAYKGQVHTITHLLLHGVCGELAEWYFQGGCAVLAACCHLAVDNTELAMASLIRGNELELAVCVGTVLGESAQEATHYVLELLARKYMTTVTWDLAIRLLQMVPDNETLLAKLCAFYPGSSAERNDLHDRCVLQCGLPSLEECKDLAEEVHSQGEILQEVKYHLLSSEPEKALPIGIAFINGVCVYVCVCMGVYVQSVSLSYMTNDPPPLRAGPVFFLEDGKSAISLNDALMWAKVNPFSPLGTGMRLNPF
ncbi:WD repeat-containing protein 17 [Bagarius yarrelli]|uniref:WD repeat-containing protein 17 n=1 Tax=Bagarius yarrelli TaxID=175774 RepID=A0A556V6W2_BAGYA|nr:WD repeat-containing protein 17 [Bagarius yarrelli]